MLETTKKIVGVNVPKCDLLYFVSECLKIPHQINCQYILIVHITLLFSDISDNIYVYYERNISPLAVLVGAFYILVGLLSGFVGIIGVLFGVRGILVAILGLPRFLSGL